MYWLQSVYCYCQNFCIVPSLATTLTEALLCSNPQPENITILFETLCSNQQYITTLMKHYNAPTHIMRILPNWPKHWYVSIQNMRILLHWNITMLRLTAWDYYNNWNTAMMQPVVWECNNTGWNNAIFQPMARKCSNVDKWRNTIQEPDHSDVKRQQTFKGHRLEKRIIIIII